jgi:hypothetical protein
MDADEIERLLVKPRTRGPQASGLAGPVTVLSEAPGHAGGTTYQVSASRLVDIDDADPALAVVSIPVPITAAVEVDGKGSLVGVSVTKADPSADREARAFTRNLIANGSVKGLSHGGPVRRGPPTRATHEVTTDDQGRRIIRRTGFTIAPPGQR